MKKEQRLPVGDLRMCFLGDIRDIESGFQDGIFREQRYGEEKKRKRKKMMKHYLHISTSQANV